MENISFLQNLSGVPPGLLVFSIPLLLTQLGSDRDTLLLLDY
jgi:hypothetical protein